MGPDASRPDLFRQHLRRAVAALLTLWLCGMALVSLVHADEEPVPVLAGTSLVQDTTAGLELRLTLAEAVPWRVFTLTDPARVVMDLDAVDWSALNDQSFLRTRRNVTLRYGTYLPGRSRLVMLLPEPMQVTSAHMQTGTDTADLLLRLAPQDPADFAGEAGVPRDPAWDLPPPAASAPRAARGSDAPLRIVLDPGHGGIDPGAQAPAPDGRGTIHEKTIALIFAQELRAALEATGEVQVILTRRGDYFVSLDRRVAMAQQADADLFLSLHADALSDGLAHGASVHLLSREASDAASEQLAQRHNRADLLAGDAPVAAEDDVALAMLDLARRETAPRSAALGKALITAFHNAGKDTITRPLRQANFAVLKSADIPSALVEIGFMSSPRDLERLTDPAWRAEMARAVAAGVTAWRDADRARKALVRH